MEGTQKKQNGRSTNEKVVIKNRTANDFEKNLIMDLKVVKAKFKNISCIIYNKRVKIEVSKLKVGE